MNLNDYLPQRVNSGRWLTAYTLDRLRQLDPSVDVVLPICSLGTPYGDLAGLGDLVLPPLFHEALTAPLETRILAQIDRCFPEYEHARSGRRLPTVRVVKLPVKKSPPQRERPAVLAFSIDTAVEQHGPHLPLATDTIQSYAVLRELATRFDGLVVGPPLDYGQLTWGLPFGFSIDLTAELLCEYVQRFIDALLEWMQPTAIYVAEVHGSIVHRQTIVEGLQRSRCQRWEFRWLYDPLVEFALERKDPHAGGVETAMIEFINRDLVDPDWWPGRIDELAAGQMPFDLIPELTTDIPRFAAEARRRNWNGIIGDIRNYERVQAEEMFRRMLDVACADVEGLLSDRSIV